MMKAKAPLKLFFFWVAFLMFLPEVEVSAKEKVLKRTEVFTSEKESASYKFPEKIKEDGKTYLLKKKEQEVMEKIPKRTKKEVTLDVESKVLRPDEEHSPKKKIKKDGITYTLDRVSEKEITIKKPYVQPVTKYREYPHKVTESEVPKTKKVVVKNHSTGEMETVTCNLTDIVKTERQDWKDTHIDIIFHTYNAKVYKWQGALVKRTENNPLKGYEKELLKSVNVSPDDYKVIKTYWVGEEYTDENGVLCRKARADVKRRTIYYRARYKGSIENKEQKGIQYTAHYKGVKLEDSKTEFTYKIKSTAEYEPRSLKPYVILTVGVLLLLVLFVLLLYLIAKRKKEEESRGEDHEELRKWNL